MDKISVGVRVAYPEKSGNWFERLELYEKVGDVEIAFYKPQFFEEIKIDEVLYPLKELNIKANSIHLPHEHITKEYKFLEVLNKTIEIANKLGCKNLVAHPSFGRLSEIQRYLDNEITPLLKKNKITLCWETFESKKRFLSGIEEIAEFCESNEWYGACYDFSHLFKSQEEVLKDIIDYRHTIKIFHLSNRISKERKQHLPIFEKGDLDFYDIIIAIKENYSNIALVLEYLLEYHYKLIDDALKLKSLI